jgi:hypothetical protein
MYNSSDLVKALNDNNYELANNIYNNGVRITFIKEFINQTKKNRDIVKLKWIYLKLKNKLNIEDLKYAFKYGDTILITIVWNFCNLPDIIETIDILEIIINRSNNNEFFNLLSILRNKSLDEFKPQIEQLMIDKLKYIDVGSWETRDYKPQLVIFKPQARNRPV